MRNTAMATRMTAKVATVVGVGVVAAAAAAGAIGCGEGDLALPAPPQDLTSTVQAYEMPTGTVDFAHLQQTVADVEAELEARQLAWLPAVVADALVRLRERFDAGGYPIDPATRHHEHRPRLDAVVELRRTCSASGTIDLTAVLDDTQLGAAIWGTASACTASVQPVAALPAVQGFVDGSLSFFLQGALPETSDDAQVVVAISGRVGTGGNVPPPSSNQSFDFRISGRQVETRHTVADGYVIVSVGVGTISVRGTNGSAACDVAAQACTTSTPGAAPTPTVSGTP